MLRNYSTKDCLSKFTMKNNIKTPRKWNEYKHEAHLKHLGCLILRKGKKRKKKDAQPSTMTFSNHKARSNKCPGRPHNDIYFTDANKPNHRKLIFNCPRSQADSMQKSIRRPTSERPSEYTTPGDEQEKFKWGLWVSKEQFLTGP